jgi:hypothetical protein
MDRASVQTNIVKHNRSTVDVGSNDCRCELHVSLLYMRVGPFERLFDNSLDAWQNRSWNDGFSVIVTSAAVSCYRRVFTGFALKKTALVWQCCHHCCPASNYCFDCCRISGPLGDLARATRRGLWLCPARSETCASRLIIDQRSSP